MSGERVGPELKIEVSSPVKAEVKVGETASEKLVDALVDAFSPGTETLGLFGDVVRLARVGVAAAITRRAKQIADDAGLALTAPPLKFLVPFFERASTEDPSEEKLVEMWANLLASAGSGYDARQMRFTSILAELSGEQARVLDATARNFGGVIGVNSDPDGLTYNLVESRLVSSLKKIDASDPDGIMDAIGREVCFAGVSVVIIQAEMREGKVLWDWTGDQVYSDALSLDFEILVSLGLMSKVATDFIDVEHAAITVTLYHLSELGFEFWSACCGGPTRGEHAVERADST